MWPYWWQEKHDECPGTPRLGGQSIRETSLHIGDVTHWATSDYQVKPSADT